VEETRIIKTEGLTTTGMPGQRMRKNNGDGTFLKKQERWECHEQALITTLQRRLSKQKGWRRLDGDNQRGQYYEHCGRSKLNKKHQCLPLLSVSQLDEEIYPSGG